MTMSDALDCDDAVPIQTAPPTAAVAAMPPAAVNTVRLLNSFFAAGACPLLLAESFEPIADHLT